MTEIEQPMICIEQSTLPEVRQEVSEAIRFDFDTFKKVRRILGWSAEQVKMPEVIAFGGVVVEGNKNEEDILPAYSIVQSSKGEPYSLQDGQLPEYEYSSTDLPRILICETPRQWTADCLTATVVKACLDEPPEIDDTQFIVYTGTSTIVGGLVGGLLQESATPGPLMTKGTLTGLILGGALAAVPLWIQVRRHREVAALNENRRQRSAHLSFFDVELAADA